MKDVMGSVGTFARSHRFCVPAESQTPGPILDSDIDSLFILPLRIIPFKTQGLRRSRLVKNNHLLGVMELYAERQTGSGQVQVEDLPRYYNWQQGGAHPDLQILRVLAPLPSYDVYSLRRSLRDNGVPVNDHAELRLSEEKNRELAGYMGRFIQPLIRQVYGDADQTLARFEDLVAMFKDPDVAKALARLKMMAHKLHITIEQIPKFIEDYGDVFLALSYYRHCLDRMEPLLETFVASMADLRNNFQVRNDRQLMQEMARIEKVIAALVTFLKRTFHDFNVMSQDMWDNLTAAKFELVKSYIENTQIKVGSVLCGVARPHEDRPKV